MYTACTQKAEDNGNNMRQGEKKYTKTGTQNFIFQIAKGGSSINWQSAIYLRQRATALGHHWDGSQTCLCSWPATANKELCAASVGHRHPPDTGALKRGLINTLFSTSMGIPETEILR